MCLMLYISTAEELPLGSSQDLRVERVSEARHGVKHWFSHPAVQFVGAHTGCSCGFPSVIADAPIDYYEGMHLESDDRAADLRSVRALIELLRLAAAHTERVELYPVADGDESKPPKGTLDWQMHSLDAERLFFNEGFLHVVHTRKAVVISENQGGHVMAGAKTTVLYPAPRDESAFERAYTQDHAPMVTPQTFPGITKFVASKVVGTPDGSPPPFYRIAELHFPSMDVLQSAAASSPAQKAVAHAVSVSSGGKPIFLVGEEEIREF